MKLDKPYSQTYIIIGIRWLTLINALVITTVWPKPWSLPIFAFIVLYNLLITIAWSKTPALIKQYPKLLAIDITIAVVSLWFTGAIWKSPYYPYCLISLVTATFFLGLKKGIYAFLYVAFLYTIGILLDDQTMREMSKPDNAILLFSSYFGFLLVAVFFSYPASIVRAIEKEQETIAAIENNIAHTKTLINSLDRNKPDLSNRELEILERLSQGKSNMQIAEDLRLAETTVKNHLYRIYKKLGINSRTAAIIYYRSYTSKNNTNRNT